MRDRPTPGIKRVLLVGFMGSGKTTVGELVARGLGWDFLDFDQEVVSRQGLSISDIFRQHGEAFFRDLEEAVGRELLRSEGVILASGGGWPMGSGRMDDLPEGTLSVWLRVPPEEAVHRARQGGARRPLLEVEDPLARARELLKEREDHYGKAMVVMNTSGQTPEFLAREIIELVNQSGGGGNSPRTTVV